MSARILALQRFSKSHIMHVAYALTAKRGVKAGKEKPVATTPEDRFGYLYLFWPIHQSKIRKGLRRVRIRGG